MNIQTPYLLFLGDAPDHLHHTVMAEDFQHRLDVDSGRPQQFFAERATKLVNVAADIPAELVEEQLAHQRVAVAVDARRRDPDDLIARLHLLAADPPAALQQPSSAH